MALFLCPHVPQMVHKWYTNAPQRGRGNARMVAERGDTAWRTIRTRAAGRWTARSRSSCSHAAAAGPQLPPQPPKLGVLTVASEASINNLQMQPERQRARAARDREPAVLHPHGQHGGQDHRAVPDLPGADRRGKGGKPAAGAAETDHGRPAEHGRENRRTGGKAQCKIRLWP